MQPMLNEDFVDILEAFIEEHVEFLLVGGFAVAANGAPRYTGDLDVWVRPDPANAERVVRGLRRFGAPWTLSFCVRPELPSRRLRTAEAAGERVQREGDVDS
jgi:hypothetical protein